MGEAFGLTEQDYIDIASGKKILWETPVPTVGESNKKSKQVSQCNMCSLDTKSTCNINDPFNDVMCESCE